MGGVSVSSLLMLMCVMIIGGAREKSLLVVLRRQIDSSVGFRAAADRAPFWIYTCFLKLVYGCVVLLRCLVCLLWARLLWVEFGHLHIQGDHIDARSFVRKVVLQKLIFTLPKLCSLHNMS